MEQGGTTAGSAESASAPPNLVPAKHPQRAFFFLEYNLSMPVGSTHDFAGNFSGRGVALDFRYLLWDQVSLGMRMGWHVFSDKVSGTATSGGVTLTSTQIRNLNIFPLAVTGAYHFQPVGKRSLVPFVGLGLGPYYAERLADLSHFAVIDDGFHFGITPEVGVLIPLVRSVITVNARFNYLFESVKADEAYFNFNVGLDF